jgi:hypothetical protein
MPTLYDQPPRQDGLENYASSIKHQVRLMFGSKNRYTPAEWHAACDVVRTACVIQSGDVQDEQLAGFANLLQELLSRLSMINLRD